MNKMALKINFEAVKNQGEIQRREYDFDTKRFVVIVVILVSLVQVYQPLLFLHIEAHRTAFYLSY